MIDCYPRRQHSMSLQHLQPTDLPSPTPTEPSFFDNLPYSISTPSPADFQRTFRSQYLDAPTLYVNSFPESPYSESAQDMNTDFHIFNPSIRVQQSTPTPSPAPQYPSANSQQLSMRMTEVSNQHNWQIFDENTKQFNMNSAQEIRGNGQFREGRNHRREHSSSSMGSSGPASPYSHTTTYPYIANTDQSPQTVGPFDGFTGADDVATYTKALPTPMHTPTTTSFLLPQSSEAHYSQGYNDTSSAHLAVKQATMDRHSGVEDETPAFSNSARQSVSSLGRDSPVTPRSSTNELDNFKLSPTGEDLPSVVEAWQGFYLHMDDESDFTKGFPNLGRTMSDVCQDELYNPSNATSVAPPPAKKVKHNPTPHSPMRKNLISERLQQAERVRSQSPATTSSNPIDTLTSHHLPSDFRSPGSLLGSAAVSREQQKSRIDALAMRSNHLSTPGEAPSTTISPKDAVLDYQSEEDQMPLFPDDNSAEYSGDYSQGQWSSGQDQSSIPAQDFSGMVAQSHPSAFTASVGPRSNFYGVPSTMPAQMTPGYTYSGSTYRPTSTATSAATESAPEFPAHLTSMESSVSEVDASAPTDNRRPARTSADTGTYSCTYHGCPMRFDNPQKLQKHKRENHRSVHHPLASLPGRAVSSDDAMSSASSMTSDALLARNSQAGPHRCERINPSTGKPCNTIFSRPYDLTRHEDTIHNARKQKVRCALCIEEKTFSRNDALTRHMRVVHPEVDFPGKHRRRGGH